MKIEYTEDNAAFADDASEHIHILHRIAAQIENGQQSGVILDMNGNRVGSWKTDPKYSDDL